jgi:DNA/RNA-binding domain of Phe-tRNA-synthetase-like protein
MQLHALIGILEVDPSDDTDIIFEILTEAQEAPLHEEWVRVAAGLVQRILFYRDSRARDMREEAQKLLEKHVRTFSAENL